jgi:photosystem II stability/assembly factor-like uncharacterized protein
MGVKGQWVRCGILLVAAFLTAQARAVSWFALGPYGGDARSFAVDPQNQQHLFLGTATGWVYESTDGGDTWNRIAQVGKRNDLVIDHILVDARNPKRLMVGAWIVDRPDGGLYISEDGGKNWYDQAEMRGQSIRALARAQSNPDMLVAGTLQGVFRSMDDGKHWKQISPPGSMEIHEIESVAIDPMDPNVIYAGTWHLPWKTSDGGQTWANIKKGIIDDSDVFSIIVDPKQPNIVYASACSGIYKSQNAGAEFSGGVGINKGQGIPTSARRTRKLAQDPERLDTVFAGTTEGLYRSVDAGQKWLRLTGPDVIVNDVFIDPKDSNHVLLATDRAGVLASSDGGVNFHPSNNGFSARQVTSYTADAAEGGALYVGVVNDKQTGGVFQSRDGGVKWSQQSDGLNGRDVFSLVSTSDGTLLAGTGHGVFRLDGGTWSDSSGLAGAAAAPPKPVHLTPEPTTKQAKSAKQSAPKPAAPKPVAPVPAVRMDDIVYALANAGDGIYAGTEIGLMRGDATGRNWAAVASLQMPDTRFVAVQGPMVMAAGLNRIALSMDKGASWDAVALPADLTQISAMAIDELKNLWVGGREGVYYSTDYGLKWKQLRNLYLTEVNGIYFDPVGHRVMVTSSNSTVAFAAHLPDYKVSYWETGWHLRFIRPVGDHLIGATLFDGMVVQPKMVDSKFADASLPEAKKLTAEKLPE